MGPERPLENVVSDNNGRKDANLARQHYGDEALKIARYALIAHASGKPLKRRDLMQALRSSSSSEIPRALFVNYVKRASDFLKDKFGMRIVELEPVKLRGTQSSPSRDEYMLISLSHTYRSMFHKVVSKSQLSEWGVMCYTLILIVLKSDGVRFSELCTAFRESKLRLTNTLSTPLESENDNGEEERLKSALETILQKLVSQRVFEVAKSKKDSIHVEEGGSGGASQTEDTYFIGPYAKYLVNSRELFQMILKLHYPNEKTNTPEFKETYAIVMRSLKQKFESTCLGSV